MLMRRPCVSALCLALLLPAAACKKGGDVPAGGKTSAQTGGDKAAPQAPLAAVGVQDPFPRLNSAGAKALERGYKLLREKKYDDAATAFGEVLSLVPDYLPARQQRARALLLGGKLAEAEADLEGLLSRDFVAQAGRWDKPKEWKPLRESPSWAAYTTAEGRYKDAYAAGLSQGFVFIARSKAVTPPTGTGEVKLPLNQEVYHYDPTAGRYRRLTATDGQIFAAERAPSGKVLAFLVVSKLKKGDADQLLDPQGGYIDLTTLETVGPFKIAGAFHQVSIGFGADGAPIWSTQTAPGTDGGAFTVDTAKTGMAKAEGAPQGSRTWAQADKVWHSGQGSPAGVTMAADHRSFAVEGGGKVTAARDLADASIEWSPGKKRLTYAGQLDACQILAQPAKKGGGDKNELYVYDIEKKSASRVDSGVSEFETLWLSDDLLVYENGVGAQATVNLYDLPGHRKVQLAGRNGAGLYGMPSLSCQQGKDAAKDEPDSEPDTLPDAPAEE